MNSVEAPDRESRTSSSQAARSVDPDRIAARAYELYLARGGMDGLDQDDWFRAERELWRVESDRQE